MEYCDGINEITGYADEKKIVCSSIRALANMYLLFKENIENSLSSEYLDFKKAESFHAFISMLDLLLFDKSEKFSSETPELSKVDCLPSSKSFYYPQGILSFKKKHDLNLVFDNVKILGDSCDFIRVEDLFKSNNYENKLSKYIQLACLKVKNLFGNLYFCNIKHDHKKCIGKLNKLIELDIETNKEFNSSDKGSLLFDYIINFIKLIIYTDVELLALVYLKILNKDNISDSIYFKVLKDEFYKMSKQITLYELSCYLQLNVINHSLTHLVRELVDCHFCDKIEKNEYSNKLMFD